jgi:hypothetical protein
MTAGPDLWCTYAAVRTLRWLDRLDHVTEAGETATYLAGRRNADGGYAWSRGMQSDVWATFYCLQSLTDLGAERPALERTQDWLTRCRSGEAYAMMPGQAPCVWATHFATRALVEVCGVAPQDPEALLRWLGALQTASGGLSWSPEHAKTGRADVRACHYGIAAWRAIGTAEPPWDVPALIAWVRDQQVGRGGFRFSPASDVPCLWATYRATAALAALGARPAHPCTDWVLDRRHPEGGFVRWADYDVPDVWASFCAVGSLRSLDVAVDPVVDEVTERIATMACAGGGYTYREPVHAANALSAAAAALTGDPGAAREWLAGCLLPNEGGVMYMPGRGSEVRCTLWALAAGAFAEDATARGRIRDWLGDMQNPDGGFGYWEGRGSDLVSTAAAVESAMLLGDVKLDTDVLAEFLLRCRRAQPAAYGHVPGASPTLRAGLQAMRVWQSLGRTDQDGVTELLARHRVSGGGYANEGSRMPDLLSTYEAVATADRVGVRLDTTGPRAFLDRVRTPAGTAWSPLGPPTDDPLADCLGTLLHERLTGERSCLPALTLS